MQISALVHRVALVETPEIPSPDGHGDYLDEPQPLSPSEWWASITPATAADLERIAAGTVVASATHIVRMRYHPGVTLRTTVRFGTRSLQVTGLQNVEERNRELVLVCREAL
jgi:head-tail adaptor